MSKKKKKEKTKTKIKDLCTALSRRSQKHIVHLLTPQLVYIFLDDI